MDTEHIDTQRSRPAQVADWLGWHIPELLAVAIPALLAWLITPWLWLLVAAIAATWAARSLRQALRHRQLRAERKQVTSGEQHTPAENDAEAHTEVSA